MASAANDQLNINLFDPELQQCPYDAYKQLRDEAPVYRRRAGAAGCVRL